MLLISPRLVSSSREEEECDSHPRGSARHADPPLPPPPTPPAAHSPRRPLPLLDAQWGRLGARDLREGV